MINSTSEPTMQDWPDGIPPGMKKDVAGNLYYDPPRLIDPEVDEGQGGHRAPLFGGILAALTGLAALLIGRRHSSAIR